jgi:UDP-2,4-diacetamido-2,4,6-trideoxy-beta-L-altropyranose hydrolase
LQQRGAAVTFLCRRQAGSLIGLLEQEFSVLALPERTLAPCGGVEGRVLYSAWLGCSQAQDATDCLQVLDQTGIRNASWLVVDHYGLDTVWETQMLAGLDSNNFPRLLVIDDLADRPHQADLLLDQNFYGDATEVRYADLVPQHCRKLLGPHYALLGPEYAQLHPLVPSRMELRRVLVFFGGVDHGNLTSSVLEVLKDSSLSHLAVDVVLGHQSMHRQSVIDIVKKRDGITFHDPLPSLAGLIARADISIGAAGATTWERFCLGCPSVSTVIADNQIELAHALGTHGLAYIIKNSSLGYGEACYNAIKYFMDSTKLRLSSELTCGVCDGNGAKIVSEILFPLSQ